jgi:ABC-type branched-subunit amino acid transport system substrate-binding protein
MVIVDTSGPSTVQIVSYPFNLAQARPPHRLTIALTILFLCLGSREAEAADSPGEIVLGMSTVLTGNVGNLGKEMQRGILAGLEPANRNGGVNGRKLRLISLDDGYEPTRTAPNMRQLIEKDHVLRTEHQASHRVWPTILRGGRFEPFQRSGITALSKGEALP